MTTDREREEWEEWAGHEESPPTPVEARFQRHHFVSTSRGRSKGVGRRLTAPRSRQKLEEVTLIADTMEPERPQRWQTERLFPFDTKATEVYDDSGAESERLRKDIERL